MHAGASARGGSCSSGADISAASAATSWSGPVAVHAAPRARRSRFVRALEEEPEQAAAPTSDGGTPETDAAFQEALETAARCTPCLLEHMRDRRNLACMSWLDWQRQASVR